MPATVTITIQGTNDQPVVEPVTLAGVEEGTSSNTFEGSLVEASQLQDDDANDNHEFFAVLGEDEETTAYTLESPAAGVSIENITVNTDGTYSVTGDFNALAKNETATVTFSYYAVDSSATQANGESNKSEIKTVTMTITGTNDAPVAVADINSVTERGDESLAAYGWKGVAEGNLLTNDIDVDHGADLDIVSVGGQFFNAFGEIIANGQYGALHVNKESGKYEYVVNNLNSSVNGLDSGEILTETFSYVVTDEHGATSTSTLEVTIKGTNDAPTIFASTGNWFNVNDTVDESALANGTDQKGTTAIAYGTFTIGDADGLDDIKSISVAGTSFTVSSDNNFADLVGQTVTTEYGEVTIASYSHGTFNYTYTLTSPTTDVKNVTETDSFKVIVSDGDKSDSATVTINITDDAPIAFKDAQTTNEDAVSISGNVLENDKVGADGVQSVSFSTTQGTYGTLSYNTATGAYTYTLNPNAQTLAQGDSVQEKFTYTVTDGDGDKASNTLAIKVTGTNDAPVATVEENFGVNEDSIVHGKVVADDIDSDDNSSTLTYSLVEGKPVPAGFTLDSHGNYTFDATNSAYQSLGVGETQNVTFTWKATDSHGATTTEQTVTITVKGTNDAPLLDLNGADETYVESFEGLMGYSGWTILGSSSFTGDHGIVWTTTGHNLEIQNNGVTVSAASAGHALAELDSNGLVTLSTTLALNDTTATVAFDYHARPNSDSDSDMKVTLGNSSFTIDNSGTDLVITTTGNISVNYTYDATSGWYSFSVTATGLTVGNNILSFEGTGVSNGLGALIDNIAIKTSNGVGYETSFTENGASVSIADTDVSISDIDDSNIESASIVLTNAQAGDFLVYNGMTYNTIVDGKITVNITETATLSAYQDMIKSITYGSTSENPDTTDRVIEVVVNDGNANSNTATTVVHVTAINDAPVAIDDSYSYLGENLIINGSFEDINGVNANGQTVSGVALGSLTGTTLVHMKSITGWDLTDETMAPMEPHAGGHAGVGTTDGAHYMDLGASPGNSAISQTIGGLTGGSLYQFSVDYRDKAAMQESGADGKASGVMEILWNGVVVATVQGNNVDAWKTLTLNVTAVDDENTLTFREIGVADDNWGIAIDNVQLKSINTALVTDEDTALTIMPATLLGNDTDIDGGALFITSVTQPDAAQGTITTTSDVNGHITSILFTPTKDYNGNATFTYTISDGNGGTDTATVTLRVNPVNDAPIAVDDAFVTDEGIALTSMNVLGNDTDKENDTLSVTNANSHDGTVSINPDGTLNFTPNANFTGVATITYAISDGNGGTDTATVLVTVNAVEHTPTLTVDTGNMGNANDTVLESGLATGSSPSTMTKTAEGTFTIGDPDGLDDITSITIGNETFSIGMGVGAFPDFASLVGETITTSHGEVAITSYSNGVFVYSYTLTEASNATSDSFNVSASDGSETASATVTVGITDDKPIAYDNAVSLVEGTASSGGGITNILLVLDFSGSMYGANLTAMKASVIELVNAYQDAGGFNLKIVPFNGDLDYTTESGLNTIFTDVTSVTNWLNTVTSWDLGWSTNYEAAVEAAMSTWTSANIAGADVANSIAYFISDGQPNEGNMSSVQTTWENYVDANFTKAIAIGIGNGATAADADLQAVAYTPGGSDEVYLVTNLSELTDTLVGTVEVPTTSTGSVVTETGVLNLVDVSGADGWANPILVSVTYDGTTHTFDSTHTSFTIPTNAGTVTIDNQGNYTFTSLTNVSHDVSANLTYTVVDSDGSTAQAVLNVTTLDSVPTAVADTATATETYLHATGGTANNTVYTTVPESWSASASEKPISGTWNINPSYYNDDSGNTTSFSITANTTHQASVSVYVDVSNYKSGDSVTVSLYTADGNLVNGQSKTISTDGTVTFSGISASGTYQVHVEGIDNTWKGDLKVKLNDLKVTSYTYTPAKTTSTLVATQEIEWVAAVAAVGNVLTNDIKGTDGNLSVTIVNGHEITAAGVDITGNNGVLHIDATGAYTYTPTNADMTSAELSTPDVFAYTIQDADGSTSSSTLTISIADHNYVADSSIFGGTDGNDTLNGNNGDDVLYGSAGDDHLYGGAGNDTLYGGEGNDYLDGGTGRDILHGDAGNDTLVYDAQDILIDGGTGSDTLLFTSNTTIDFSTLDSTTNPVKNVEVLDLTQATVEIKNLSLQDVIDMTDSNNTLTILGDSTNDKVDFEGNGWSKAANTVTETINGASHTFEVYTNAGDPSVVVKVEQIITDTI